MYGIEWLVIALLNYFSSMLLKKMKHVNFLCGVLPDLLENVFLLRRERNRIFFQHDGYSTPSLQVLDQKLPQREIGCGADIHGILHLQIFFFEVQYNQKFIID